MAPLLQGRTTDEPPSGAFGRAAALTETPDREPALPIRRRSAGPSSGDVLRGDPPLEEPRAARAAESWSGTVSASRWGRDTVIHGSAPLLPLFRTVPGRIRDRLGPVPLDAGSALERFRTIRWECPSEDGRPEPPGIRPGRDGPAAEPRGRGFLRGVPRPRPLNIRSGAAPWKGSRTGGRAGTSPVRGSDSWHTRAGEVSVHDQRSPPRKAAGNCIASCGARRHFPEEGPACGSVRGRRTRGPEACRLQCLLRGLGPSRPAAADSVLAPSRDPRTAHPRFGFEGSGTGANRSAPESEVAGSSVRSRSCSPNILLVSERPQEDKRSICIAPRPSWNLAPDTANPARTGDRSVFHRLWKFWG